MPRTQPIVSYLRIRDYAERFEWFDPKKNRREKGFNPPPHATDVQRVPFHVRFLTKKGKIIEGEVITIQVDTKLMRRNLMFTASQECIWAYDMLIIEIDGVRFQSH